MSDISVVIPCYRCSATIRRALASAVEQSEPPREIVLVDDASGDDTVATLEALQRQLGERVRIVRQPQNRGPASARNAGWDAARGALIAFLDADDAWHPRKLELQRRFMQERPEFVLTGHLNGTGRMTSAEPPTAPNHREIGMRSLLFGRRFSTTSAMLRRELPLRFPEGERYAEDYHLWLRVVASGHRLAQLDAELSTRFEPEFGGGGLSGHLWSMEKAELRIYQRLHREKVIGTVTFALTTGWSLTKYARRLALTRLRRV